MNHSPSLKSVTKQFTSWRDSHPKRSYTPKLLQQQAVALKSQYSVTQIINALKKRKRGQEKKGGQVEYCF